MHNRVSVSGCLVSNATDTKTFNIDISIQKHEQAHTLSIIWTLEVIRQSHLIRDTVHLFSEIPKHFFIIYSFLSRIPI